MVSGRELGLCLRVISNVPARIAENQLNLGPTFSESLSRLRNLTGGC